MAKVRNAGILVVALFAIWCAINRPVSLSVTPHGGMAPAAFRVVVTVEPDDRNRGVVISIDGDNYVRRTYEQLDGADAPRVRAVIFDHVPAGSYVVSAVVGRGLADSAIRAQDTVCVIGGDQECQ